MLNVNLSKNDIGYLRLLIDIESCEIEKNFNKTQNDETKKLNYNNLETEFINK